LINFQSISNFKISITPKNKNYNLERRTALFAERIIEFSQKIKKNVTNIPIISQLIKSGTSMGANYCEAINVSSKKDFKIKFIYAIKRLKKLKIG
jgi:four helix bundle protein